MRSLAMAELNRIRLGREAQARSTVTSYCPHEPHPKQRAFLDLDDRLEVLYGGAGGGGKSDALLMAALRYVHVPGYSALLLRRTFKDLMLPSAILARAESWWRNTPARWDAANWTWHFPTLPGQADATIAFGYLAKEKDKFRYQSAEFQFVGFDELTHFSLTQYSYLFTRLRRLKGSVVPLRMRGATNPGGVGHEWVKERFVAHANEERPDFFVSPPSAESIVLARELGRDPQGATFIKALMRDNPTIDEAEYRAALVMADEVSRRQIEFGDWDAVPGGEFFEEGWFEYLDEPPSGVRWLRYWDLAATKPSRENPDPDWTVGAKVGLQVLPGGLERVIVADVRRDRLDPGGVEDLIKATAEADGRGVPIWLEQEPGSAGKSLILNYKRKLVGWVVDGDKKTGDKHSMWRPVSSQAKAHNFFLVRAPWNAALKQEFCRARTVPFGHDDQLDAVGGGFAKLTEQRGTGRMAAALGHS